MTDENRAKLKVTEQSYDFDGTIYLQTLISKQNTEETEFEIFVEVLYNGNKTTFSQTIGVDNSSSIAWKYDGLVEDATKLVQQAYVALGTTNEKLTLVRSGNFDSFSSISVSKVDAENDGKLMVSQVSGTSRYVLSVSKDAEIGSTYIVSITGNKKQNGYTKKITRQISFTVVDYVLYNGAF